MDVARDNGHAHLPQGLLVEALRGDRDALEAVVRRYRPSIGAFLYRLVGNFHDAQDLAQETFLRALRSLPTVASPEGFRPWLFRIALNLARDFRRHRRVEGMAVPWRRREAWAGADEADPATVEENLPEVMRALGCLPEGSALVILLRSLEGMSYGQMAEVLGITPAAAKVRLHRGRRRLEEHLRIGGRGAEREAAPSASPPPAGRPEVERWTSTRGSAGKPGSSPGAWAS